MTVFSHMYIVLDRIKFLNKKPFEIEHAWPLDSESQLPSKAENIDILLLPTNPYFNQ